MVFDLKNDYGSLLCRVKKALENIQKFIVKPVIKLLTACHPCHFSSLGVC